MIRVGRIAKPAVLAKRQVKWTQALLGAGSKKERTKAENKYRHRKIKDALVEMFHGKCAYCESKITHIDYGHIEHYRPKSLQQYYHLTFEWDNLLLSCAVCNGAEYKGTRFPEATDGGPFVNPCQDEPSEHLDFIFDLNTRLATVVGKSERGKTTEKLLGLNRPELRKYRSDFVYKLYVLARFAAVDQDQEARELIQAACGDDVEYAAFARMLQSLNFA